MKKIIISISVFLLALCMALPGMAVEVSVLKTLEAEIATANGGTVKLTNDIADVTTERLLISKDVTLDLAGHTITFTEDLNKNNRGIEVTDGAKVVITSSTGVGKVIYGYEQGITVRGDCSYGDNRKAITSTVTLKGNVEIKGLNENKGSTGVTIFGKGATLNIYDGVKISGHDFGIAGNGTKNLSTNKDNGGTTINIYGGEIKADAFAIYHPQDGILNMSGGTITGADGIQFKAGGAAITKVSGGVIKATGNFIEVGQLVDNSNGAVVTGSAISLIGNDSYTGNMTLNISGNGVKIISEKGYAVRQEITKGESSQISSVKISGGSFSGAKGALYFKNFTADKDKYALTGGSYSSNPKEYVGPGYAVAKHGDMFVVEIPAPAPTSPDLPADKPKEVQPVTPVVASVDITATAEDKAKTVSDAASYADKGTITAADLEVSPQGFVVPKEAVVQAAFADAMQKSNKEGSITEVNVLPLFLAKLTTSGDVAAISYSVKGSDLKAAKAGDVRVIKVLTSGTGEFFTFQSDSSKTADKNFALQLEGDKKFLAAADAIEAGKNYKLLLFVKDNGDFDLRKDTAGEVVDPAAIAKTTEKAAPTPTPTPTPTGGSSSSGCNAGLAALALLGVALVPSLYRKKR